MQSHRESENKLLSLLNNMPGIVFRCKYDRNFTMEYMSDGCFELTGYQPSDFINNKKRSFFEIYLMNEDNYRYDTMTVEKALSEKGIYQFVYQIKTASGEIKWVYEQGVGIYSKSGKLVALEGFITDLTEQKQSELLLKKENQRLRNSVKERYRFCDIIGKSTSMQKVYDLILKSASVDANVVIFGETGTGKELVAKAIHDVSDRSGGNFVPVNCMAIPGGLIETEFFGHRKGAFTGAVESKQGFLHESNNGTLFLDEVGGIGLDLQAKLLRAIDNGLFTPIGEKKHQKSDFRIISATNKKLSDLVKNGTMREDFFYRISVIPITLPPLKERKEDIPLIVEHLLRSNKNLKGSVRITGEQMDILLNHDWPGNVRELKNVIHRFFAEEHFDFLKSSKQDPDIKSPSDVYDQITNSNYDINDILESVEKDVIQKTLEKVQWNRTKTASILGISRKALYRKIKRLGL